MSLQFTKRTAQHSGMQRVAKIGPDPRSRIVFAPGSDGYYRLFGIRPGMNLTVFDVTVGSIFKDMSLKTEACLSISILFEAAGLGWLQPGDSEIDIPVPYKPYTLYLFFTPKGANGRYEVPEGSRFRGIDIRIDLQLAKRLGVVSLAKTLTDNHPLHIASCTGCWIGKHSLDADLASLGKSLFDLGVDEGNDLALEARCLDIVDRALPLMESKTRQPASSSRERRKVEHARALMLSNLARPWKVADVAREAGLNEKRLKTAFKDVYGTSVYRFLQHARLNEAKRLLAENDTTVTDVAITVGYSSFSHFAKLFTREFGLPPSLFRDGSELLARPSS